MVAAPPACGHRNSGHDGGERRSLLGHDARRLQQASRQTELALSFRYSPGARKTRQRGSEWPESAVEAVAGVGKAWSAGEEHVEARQRGSAWSPTAGQRVEANSGAVVGQPDGVERLSSRRRR